MGSDDDAPLGDRRVTLEQLRTFVLVARSGGFHLAGDELHRSQSAVTQNLKRLEDILGCQLIERRRGHIVGLTFDGKRFIPAAKKILSLVSQSVSDIQTPALSEHVRIGVPNDFNIKELLNAVSRFTEINGELKIEVISGMCPDILRLLKENAVDIAFIKYIPSDTNIVTQKKIHILKKDSLHWVFNNDLQFDHFSEIPLVAFPSNCAFRAVAINSLAQAGKSYYLSYISSSYEKLREAVTAGLGVGVLPKSSINKGQKILGSKQGFPLLPDINLAMVEVSSDPIVLHISEFLRLNM